MKKMFFVISGGWKLFDVLKSNNQEETSFQSDFLLKKLICRGSPEVTFCSWTKFQRAYGRSTFSKIVRKKSYNTGGSWPTWEDRHGIVRYGFWEVRIWILGMWAVPYPIINISLASKNYMLLHYWIIPENPQKYMKSPIYPLTLIPGQGGLCQSEVFPRTGYFIPAHVGAGAGQVWGVLPPALFQGRKSQEISSLDGTRHGVLV